MVCSEFVAFATKAQNISYGSAGKYDRKLFNGSPCQFPGAATGNEFFLVLVQL